MLVIFQKIKKPPDDVRVIQKKVCGFVDFSSKKIKIIMIPIFSRIYQWRRDFLLLHSKRLVYALTFFLFLYVSVSSEYRKAVLISGGTHRFLYREANLVFENNTDVFIVLHNESSALVNSPSSTALQVPYPVSETTVVSDFLSKGANCVHYFVINVTEERQKLDDAVGQEFLENNVHKHFLVKKWIPYSIMQLLRHYAFMAAVNNERSQNNSFQYSHFLYQREDNVYFTPVQMTLPIIPTLKPYLLFDDSIPLVVASKYCPWGGLSDKIFFANRLGAEILFSKSYNKFVLNMRRWLRGGKDSMDHIGTEEQVHNMLQEAEVVIKTDEFFRTELRYVGGTLCVQPVYSTCGPPGFNQNLTVCTTS